MFLEDNTISRIVLKTINPQKANMILNINKIGVVALPLYLNRLKVACDEIKDKINGATKEDTKRNLKSIRDLSLMNESEKLNNSIIIITMA